MYYKQQNLFHQLHIIELSEIHHIILHRWDLCFSFMARVVILKNSSLGLIHKLIIFWPIDYYLLLLWLPSLSLRTLHHPLHSHCWINCFLSTGRNIQLCMTWVQWAATAANCFFLEVPLSAEFRWAITITGNYEWN